MRFRYVELLAIPLSVLVAPIHAEGVAGQGTWETTLHARDLNGDGRADAYFDSQLNMTWLANAVGAGGVTVGWSDANQWARRLNVYGVKGWRLPTTVNSPTSDGFPPPVDSSELAYMFFTTLGNGSLGLTNTGPFDNLQAYIYWSSTSYAPDRTYAWVFYSSLGLQTHTGKDAGLYAWAVHSGDVLAVPEPTSAALLLIGFIPIFGIIAAKRRRENYAT